MTLEEFELLRGDLESEIIARKYLRGEALTAEERYRMNNIQESVREDWAITRDQAALMLVIGYQPERVLSICRPGSRDQIRAMAQAMRARAA